jgi:hypothetical protein
MLTKQFDTVGGKTAVTNCDRSRAANVFERRQIRTAALHAA